MDRELPGSFGQLFQFRGRRTPDAAEAAEICRKARVGVSGALPLAIRHAGGVGSTIPVPATHHALYIGAGALGTGGVGGGAVFVPGRTVDVLAPLRDVPVHVKET